MNGGETGAQRDAGWIKTNQGVAACIVGVAIALLVYLAFSDWAFIKLRDGFRLGFFTAVSVVATLACALVIMFDRRRNDIDQDLAASSWRDWAVAVLAMAISYIYFQLAWNIDFLLVTPVFLSGGIYLLGVRPAWSAIVAGVVITVVVYGLFRLLGIDLPTDITGL